MERNYRTGDDYDPVVQECLSRDPNLKLSVTSDEEHHTRTAFVCKHCHGHIQVIKYAWSVKWKHLDHEKFLACLALRKMVDDKW